MCRFLITFEGTADLLPQVEIVFTDVTLRLAQLAGVQRRVRLRCVVIGTTTFRALDPVLVWRTT